MAELGFSVVATSGNFSHETICTHEIEALTRLRGIADFFLVHDRPIVRAVDDSIVRVQLGLPTVLRRARGYAPLPVRLPEPVPVVLALGAHAKNTVAVSRDHEICLSQHVGDLETPQAFAAFQRVAADLPRMLGVEPAVVACDLDPEYLSTKHARALGRELVPVQHHYAHVLACMTEHQLTAPVLGVCWDGCGLGTDGTIWGGEFLLVTAASFERVGRCRTFRLPGGDAAVRQPRRSACGVLFEMEGADESPSALPVSWPHFSRSEHRLLRQTMERQFNAPPTSSMSHLFDAVASLLGLRQRVSFEGQAATELEFAVEPTETGHYPWSLLPGPPLIYDWAPTIAALRRDLARSAPIGRIAARFFRTLAEVIVHVAREIDVSDVALTGGCFQNRWLLEWTVARLQAAGFTPCWPQLVPGNDGGIALGQIMGAARTLHARRVAVAEAVT